jgi:carbonic anhydrase/acetyltransferase-like protein (isoleucine patch superfamily)
MTSQLPTNGIRPNPLGDLPQIDPTAFVDPSAQIMGKVIIGARVYVGPLSVIRADEVDEKGKVHPVIIEADACVQDGVVIHGRAGTELTVGPRCNISHGVIIHGPATIKADCFVAIRAVVYDSVLEESVWVGVGSVVMRTTVPANTWIPAGSIIRADHDTKQFRLIDLTEEKYKKGVHDASAALREGYLKLYPK